MKRKAFSCLPALCLVVGVALSIFGKEETNGDANYSDRAEGMRRLMQLVNVPPEYGKQVIRMIIDEANDVAGRLHLPESLPITETSLRAKYIVPPQLAGRIGAVGNITTSNYTYYVSVGRKFSYLTKNNFDKEYDLLREKYLWPTNRMDTNRAYHLAIQWLSQISADVGALERDCDVHVSAFTPEGENGSNFVPVYWVYWQRKGREGRGNIACVELLEPEKQIRQLRVENADYILRKPLEIANRDELLKQTNAPAKPKAASERTNDSRR